MIRALLAAALLLAGCDEAPPGRRLASGIAQKLTVQGGAAAFLLGAAHPDDRSVPEDLYAGDLWLGPLDGEARKVGAGVSSQPGAFAFSTDGAQVAYLASWRFRAGAGELWVAPVAGGAPVQVAAEAREFAWSPSGALAYVAPDKLGLRGGATVALAGLQTIAWSPDGKRVAARASGSSGGKLWLVEAASGAVREIASGTSDFAFAPNGTLATLGAPGPKGGDRPLLLDGKEVARATAFQFSPDGRQLALLSTAKQPGEATGDLYKLSRADGAPVLVASRVSDWRWSSSGDLLCLARYDLRARAGTLTVYPADGGLPLTSKAADGGVDLTSKAPDGGAPLTANPPNGGAGRELAGKVQSFTAFGKRVLYLVQAPQKGDFKIELWAADLSTGAPPRKIDEGVYGWDLTGGTLLYKARCAGGPRACSLLRVPFDGGAAPALVAADVAGFDLSRDGTRVLVEQPHRGATRAVDLAVVPVTSVQTERLKPVVEEVDASARFADDAGKRVVYATLAAGKQGVYAADVP